MEGIKGVLKGKKPEKKADRYLHSEAHVLADEITTWMGEPKKFGMYLGVIKRMGVARVRAVFADLKSDTRHVENPRKMFMWLISQKRDMKEPEEPTKP